MTQQEMMNRVKERAKELLTIPQVRKEYQAMENEAAAKDYILGQALITLLYTPEERAEMYQKKMAKISS